jgi:radical SAM protein with 4Fe4S-binding SPASM domain
MRNEVGMIDFGLFQRIVGQLPGGVRRVYLIKQGEPLLHPQLPEIMRYLKKERPDIEVALHTNAARLTPELSKHILQYVDFLAVSIFSIDNKTYRKVHGGGDLRKVVKNVKDFLNLRERGGQAIKVFVDYVRQKDNVAESDEAVFTFFEGEFPGISVGIHWCANFLGFGEQGNLQIYDRLAYEKFPTCIFPWVSFTICWDGMVDYCFVDPEEKYFLGNLKENSLGEIWNSQAYKEFRQLMATKEFGALEKKGMHCRKCSWLWGLKNQGIENLVRGTEKNVNTINEDPLVTDQEYLMRGFQNYLRGFIAAARQDFYMAKLISNNDAMKNKADEWVGKIEKIYNSRANTKVWEDLLNEEGKSLRYVNVTRYNIKIAEDTCL